MSQQKPLDPQTLQLAIEHAQLTAQHAAGNQSVVHRLQAIEAQLQLAPAAIAAIALGNYLGDY